MRKEILNFDQPQEHLVAGSVTQGVVDDVEINFTVFLLLPSLFIPGCMCGADGLLSRLRSLHRMKKKH